jgi:hypothetical protein
MAVRIVRKRMTAPRPVLMTQCLAASLMRAGWPV